MIKSVLIANRGEIACRIVRTAKRLGIATIAVYSDADANALHVKQANRAIHIGPSPASESYLVGNRIIAAATASGAQAIHPGFGFLSENADFAQAVLDAGLLWIGPKPASIRAMGLKDAAKRLMGEADVPVTPGYLGEDQSRGRLKTEADAIGYPVLIKAVAGGGGKGMRRVDAAGDFFAALESCQREAQASFSDPKVLIEKYIQRPRHIEVQIFGDTHGNIVHLFERDCSIQRRHQKVIEEAPAPGMDAATRTAICDAAIKAARAVDYVGAGTIEFIADASEGLRADRIWFMEMNTRLQVEHPVTEEITGVDLVEWQFRVASGEPLPMRQDDLTITGWAMEARLYAEDPARDFLPSTGRLEVFETPTGIRLETSVAAGDEISPYYDPMIAKLVVHGATRDETVAKLRSACASTIVHPVKTNAGFMARVLGHTQFVAGDVDTGFVTRYAEALMPPTLPSSDALNAAASAMLPTGEGPWQRLTGLRMNAESVRAVRMRIGDNIVVGSANAPPFPPDEEATASGGSGKLQSFSVMPSTFLLSEAGETWLVRPVRTDAVHGHAAGDGGLIAPIPARVTAMLVSKGQAVEKGQPILVLEAMKMEYTLTAPFAGVVQEIDTGLGEQVTEGMVLVSIAEKAQ
ncbi:acetyl-CoA carboxylase biotin carboxylase subunit [Pelagibacterium lentulum]|uniref:3-methylcrotonyl-CoA carboxylase subunit alpha n=1 Tax=Pelagibacterium lentulum TaxID=2029865 RepID=A0A916VV53_9HYPH|nr:acetyl/propionyl/methylcrotonyl-CoA carboxylase subunit alpha [Pelagibacterium lentulum]GGA38857.1 3-methylcrotonyl-CoA carboxylase subunit alpha [Pelagibacterium lentulum]